jgi:hypothetical protein
MRRVEGGKLEGESCWKSGGDEHVFIAGRGVGLADEAFPQTPYRTRRAVRAVSQVTDFNLQGTAKFCPIKAASDWRSALDWIWFRRRN